MENRIAIIEERLAVLRERVASLEAGVRFSMTPSDIREQQERHAQEYHAMKAAIAALTATLDARIKQTSTQTETIRYIRALIAPIVAALFVWMITGSLELTKAVIGGLPK